MKNFVGYYILGAENFESAQKEKGLLIWLTQKPNIIRRKLNQVLLGIYWVNRNRVVGKDFKKPLQNPEQPTSLPKNRNKTV